MSGARSVMLKNAGSLLGSQLVTWALTMLVTVIVPRYLGAASIGQIQIATSVWTILTVLITFGMDTLLIKETARAPQSAGRLLGTSLLLRAALFLLACGAVALYVWSRGYSAEQAWVFALIGLSQLCWILAAACRSILQGLEVMEYISVADIVSKLVYALLSVAVVMLGYGVLVVSFVALLAALVNLLFQLAPLLRRHPPRPSAGQAGPMLSGGFPFLLSGLSLVVYGQVDMLIISFLFEQEAAGWYGVASRLFATFLFIPSIFITVVFPALSRSHNTNPAVMGGLMRRSFDLLLLVSVPIGFGMAVVAQPLIDLLYGPEFANAGPILMMFGVVTIFTYMNILVGKFLAATDRQKVWAVVMAVATGLTIPLDLLFMRWCQEQFGNGPLGGTLSYLVTEGGMVLLGITLLPKGSLGWANVRAGAKILLAGLLMAGAAWAFRPMFIAVPILAGAAVYGTLIVALRVLSPEDRALVSRSAGALLARLRRRPVSSAKA